MVGPRWMQRRHDPTADAGPREGWNRRLERLLPYYEEQRRTAPVDENLAVFAAYWFTGFSCNPKAIYDKLGELAPGVRRVWIVHKNAQDALPPDVETVAPRTKRYFDVFARAKWFVNNVNFPQHYVKRPGQVHVQTHHGTPLKRMGVDHTGRPEAAADIDALLLRCARWDYSLSSNPYSTDVWARAYPTSYQTLEYGYPRNDVLATASDADVRAARASLGIPDDKRTVLFAPTHREYLPTFVPTFDVARLAAELGPDAILMTRLHYAYTGDAQLQELHRAGRILDVAAHPAVETLYLAADVLVTDYSSVMFDYAVLDRPIVIHAPDWAEYQARRGTYFDLLVEPPGIVTRTDDELVEALCGGAVDDAAAAKLRAVFRERFCPFDDGRAAERVVRHVFLGDPAPSSQGGSA